ncbi:Hypothetical protein POVR1_LOCUS176 [uncultured virus]|nr:Hypothetical protein POVR1_LOCUS176 [uncultured virus]
MFIYILRLDSGKYYVGKTTDLFRRFDEHRSGNGAGWTRRHKPVFVERVIENVSPFDEDKYVKEYMCKYGIANVRGGVYVTDILTDQQIETLVTEIRGASDVCLRCGSSDHFISDCHLKKSNASDELLTGPISSPRPTRRRAVSSSPTPAPHNKRFRASSLSGSSELIRNRPMNEAVNNQDADPNIKSPPKSPRSYNDGNLTPKSGSPKPKPRSRRPDLNKPGPTKSAYQYIPLNTVANSGTINTLITTAIEKTTKGRQVTICDRCKRSGHDSRFCFAKYLPDGTKIIKPCGHLADTCFVPCRKCGKSGHPEAKCYKG